MTQTCIETPTGEPADAASILLVEDDPSIERTVRAALSSSGYNVVSAASGAEMQALLRIVQPDLIVLDLVLPDVDGLILVVTLQAQTTAPVLICSARHAQVDRVLGLKLGAADFVDKPFDLDELEARISSLLRRWRSLRTPGDEIRVGDLVIRQSRASVKIADRPVHLTPTEFRLLVTLASEPDTVFGRDSLIKRVWGYEEQAHCGHLVDVHIGRLRRKLRSVSRKNAVCRHNPQARLLADKHRGGRRHRLITCV